MTRATLLLVVAATLWCAPGHAAPSQDPPTFSERYASPDGAHRAEAVALLMDADDAVKLRVISKSVLPKEKRADVIASAVRVLQTVKDDKVIEEIVKRSLSGPVARRLVYVEAMAKLRATPSHAALLGMLKDKEALVRAMAAYGLGQHRSTDAMEPLLGALDDRNWQVQSAALGSIARLGDKSERQVAVPRLVAFLEWVSGRLKTDTAEALRKITGQRYGTDLEKWQAYLGPRSDVPAVDPADDRYAPAPLHYYGLEVTSNRIVLAIDTSKSMAERIELDIDRLRRESSRRRRDRDAAEADDGDEEKGDDERAYDLPWWRIKTRFDLAREQAILLISGLREHQQFEVILFGEESSSWMGKLVEANQPNRQRAIEMLRKLRPAGRTDTWGAISRAFNLKGKKGAPDVLYLVTDGAPSVGDIVDPDSILEAALHMSRRNNMKINTIGIGVRLKFLRKLSRATRGTAKFFTD